MQRHDCLPIENLQVAKQKLFRHLASILDMSKIKQKQLNINLMSSTAKSTKNCYAHAFTKFL